MLDHVFTVTLVCLLQESAWKWWHCLWRPPRLLLPFCYMQTDAQTPMKSPLLVGLENWGKRQVQTCQACTSALPPLLPTLIPSLFHLVSSSSLSPLSLFTFPSITLMSLFACPSPSHLTHNTHTYFPLLSPLLPSLSLLSLFPITSGPTLLSSQCFPSREPKLFERMCARRVKSPAPPIVTVVSTYNVSLSLELSIDSNVVYIGMCEVKAAEK